MGTSIVPQAILARIRCAVDVGVVSGHGEIRLSGTFRESHMVRSDQAIATVANFGTPAQVYSRRGKNVISVFCHPMNNGQFQTVRPRLGKARKTIELDIEIRIGAVDIRRVDIQDDRFAARGLESLNDSVFKRRL